VRNAAKAKTTDLKNGPKLPFGALKYTSFCQIRDSSDPELRAHDVDDLTVRAGQRSLRSYSQSIPLMFNRRRPRTRHPHVPFAEHSAEANCGIFQSYPRERCTKTRSGEIDGPQDRPKDASRGPKAILLAIYSKFDAREPLNLFRRAHSATLHTNAQCMLMRNRRI
jgi:hypothetical protein